MPICRLLEHARRTALVALLVFPAPMWAQSAAIAGAGYQMPTPIQAAPGQLITIFASGLGKNIGQKVSAQSLPLPTTLSGVSVSMTQASVKAVPAPLLSVFPVANCLNDGGNQCTSLLGITLQIPFEMYVDPDNSFSDNSFSGNDVRLTVTDVTGQSATVQVSARADRIHVLNGQTRWAPTALLMRTEARFPKLRRPLQVKNW